MALRILLAILILAVPLELPGCGPFLPEALFHMTKQPEAPPEFARGVLGILQPTYERPYQVMAYRHLSGAGLSDAEQQAFLPQTELPTPPNPWLEARNKVAGIQPLRELNPDREVKRAGYYETYLNCNSDAFVTATATLQKRITPLGTAATADWIAAQDVVFADCSHGAALPQPAADPRLRADRDYQTACAKFYSEQYDDARQSFQTIAADPSSPWRGIAPYLSARCLIRAGKFAEADTQLQNVDTEPARRLRGYVGARLHPAERMHQLALNLVQPDSRATLGQDLIDYRMLFDKDVKPQPADDLTDWILSFQAGGAGAVDKWRANQSLPWLVAALQATRPRDTAVPELLAAAGEVKSDSPGYLTVNYHRVRLLPSGDARALADQLLSGPMPTAARNQVRAQRLQLARDFTEFLRYAPRRPVADASDEVVAVTAKVDYLDDDATQILNRDVPLTLLQQAAASSLLPDRTRQELRRVISLRTLLLSDSPPFDQVFALLKTPGMQPDVRPGYGRYTKEPAKSDLFHDNWWCSQAPPKGHADAGFLPAADQQQAAREQEKLQAVAAAPDWMAAQTLAFAQQHPQDSRIPEALYLVVRATRYGCKDSQTGDFSKRAFDVLHRRYASTEWARKTPYWFK